MTVSARLLDWYDRSHRPMPWRVPPDLIKQGVRPDPYRVWLSEIMLQQTTVATVTDYFVKFTLLWPTVQQLSDALEEDILKAWAGLGYYSRARNLKKCAGQVVHMHGGRFPETAVELQKLPGIGPYTAAAIAAIAFSEPVPVVDGNVERVVSRMRRISTPPALAKRQISSEVARLIPLGRPGDFAQAMMDLGATICTPRNPSCTVCPVSYACGAHLVGNPQAYPVKVLRKAAPRRVGAVFVATNSKGEVLLRKRRNTGLLAGMSEAPTTNWSAQIDGATGPEAAPISADWRRCGSVRHVFTHFELELVVFHAEIDRSPPDGHWWSADHGAEALPTLMKKAISAALA